MNNNNFVELVHKKTLALDTQTAYKESRDVPEWEREYFATLIKELDKVKNLDDKVDYLLMNGVRYVGDDSYWSELERAFPQFVNLVLKQEEKE